MDTPYAANGAGEVRDPPKPDSRNFRNTDAGGDGGDRDRLAGTAADVLEADG